MLFVFYFNFCQNQNIGIIRGKNPYYVFSACVTFVQHLFPSSVLPALLLFALPVLYLSMILLSDLPVLHMSVLPMVGAGVQAFSSYVLILAAALLMFTKAF